MIAKDFAQQASLDSFKHVHAKDKEAWLALFADNAVLKDPVGVSPLDPAGKGHKGRDAIAAFWDLAIATGEMTLTIEKSHPCGDECANVVSIIKKLSPELTITSEMVAAYKVNSEGKIESLKAYWDFDLVQAQLDKAFK